MVSPPHTREHPRRMLSADRLDVPNTLKSMAMRHGLKKRFAPLADTRTCVDCRRSFLCRTRSAYRGRRRNPIGHRGPPRLVRPTARHLIGPDSKDFLRRVGKPATHVQSVTSTADERPNHMCCHRFQASSCLVMIRHAEVSQHPRACSAGERSPLRFDHRSGVAMRIG